jgi:uncharacterized repeat protein (TIGR03803 family)
MCRRFYLRMLKNNRSLSPRFLLRSFVSTVTLFILTITVSAQTSEKVLLNTTPIPAGGSLIFGKDGNLYGITQGDQFRGGTVFSLRPFKNGRWEYRLLHKFTGGSDGASPHPGLVFDATGNLYGTTRVGGANDCEALNFALFRGCGTIFELSPTPTGPWTEKIVYSFPGNGGPANPSAGLISDGAGNFYGATLSGGTALRDGTVFKATQQPDATWGVQQLFAFTATNTFGTNVSTPLALDGKGNLYGATSAGGNGTYCPDPANGCGTIFELSPVPSGPWTYSLVYTFCSRVKCTDSMHPNGVVVAAKGKIYGTTAGAFQLSPGNAFELYKGTKGLWNFKLLHTFCSLPNCADGEFPSAAPVFDTAGNLYAPTGQTENPPMGEGTIFKLSPEPEGKWQFSSLYSFCASGFFPCTDGAIPAGLLTIDNAGDVYGTTDGGGKKGGGVVFQIVP